jgi:hypothetical protein
MALVPGVLSVGGASHGAASIEVVGPSSQLGDDAESLLRDLVMRGVGADVLGSTARLS